MMSVAPEVMERKLPRLTWALCPLWVKTGEAQTEHKVSTLRPDNRNRAVAIFAAETGYRALIQTSKLEFGIICYHPAEAARQRA